eukprot:CAMPEP_0196577878 /NCGR_PEP_ID=MMETSP1081-20130531/6885_1 /TAXON_ID=36882 /ORGANISM="Pyramimonas amylifera, Strain CCMP720" /LENGTH=246 /DNA_ID=CAMNT_0041896929 /DNA_START=10 /DNA_END=750 /DNA_ORIENTATION=+
MKYVASDMTESVAEAFEELCLKCLATKIHKQCSKDGNLFRRYHLYTRPVDSLFRKNSTFLHAVYNHFKRTARRLSLGGWWNFLRETGLLLPDVTGMGRREACLCFLAARMATSDELRSLDKSRSLTYVDFLEALARTASSICPPTSIELHEWGAKGEEGLYYYYYRLEKTSNRKGPRGRIPRRPSADITAEKTRPLHEKLEPILGVVRKSLMAAFHARDEENLILQLQDSRERMLQQQRHGESPRW